MNQFTYKVVPFIGRLKSGESASAVATQLQSIIAEHADKGWEFYQLTNTNIEVAPGCIAALFGAKASYFTYDQIVFRKAG